MAAECYACLLSRVYSPACSLACYSPANVGAANTHAVDRRCATQPVGCCVKLLLFISVAQVRAQELRNCYREQARNVKTASSSYSDDMAKLKSMFPESALTDGGDSLEVPFTSEGLRLALLNAERWVKQLLLAVCGPTMVQLFMAL